MFRVLLSLLSLMAAHDSIAADLSTNTQWLRLGHYNKKNNAWQSEVMSDDFFLATTGLRDPQSELVATEELFQKGTDQQKICRYPARRIFLEKQGQKYPKVECKDFEAWKKSFQAKEIYVLFASAYLNNPSSMYGHPFLRFSRGGKTEGQVLLDQTISFGADTGDAGGFSYVMKGLFGGFSGRFTAAPFYLKVQEYNNMENRDFWEYKVQITQEEIDFLVAHAWELRNISFPYYFFKKNCALYLLDFLEIAKPELNLKKKFPFWAIPADAIRAMRNNALLLPPIYRPSRLSKLLYRSNFLQGKEKDLVKDLVNHEGVDQLAGMTDARKVFVLDAAYEYFRYKIGSPTTISAEQSKTESFLLEQRASVNAPPEKMQFQKLTPPEEAHKTERLGFFLGKNNQNTLLDIHYRPALHDVLGAPAGYESGSELAMGDTTVRWEDRKLFLEHFDLLRVRSYTPFTTWTKKTSWNMTFGTGTLKDFDCSAWNCFYSYMEIGGGLTLPLFSLANSFLFSTLDLNNEFSPRFEGHYRLGLGPNAGIKLQLMENWQFLLETKVRARLFGIGEKKQQQSIFHQQAFNFHKNHELRLKVEKNRSEIEASIGYLEYF